MELDYGLIGIALLVIGVVAIAVEGALAAVWTLRLSRRARALSERLERVSRERRGSLANRLIAIGKDCAAHLKEPFRSIDHAEFLYDERGLPR